MICVRRTTIVQRSPPRKEPIKTNELVFLEPNKIGAEPFTTSDVIAEMTGNNYRSVQRIIEKQMERLKTFGQVRFQITPVKYDRGTNLKKVYQLNEPQATLLILFSKIPTL